MAKASNSSVLSKVSGAVDPALAALFASSSGPVPATKKPSYSSRTPGDKEDGTSSRPVSTSSKVLQEADSDAAEDDARDEGQDASNADALSKLVTSSEKKSRKRKRKQVDELDEIERRHLEKTLDDDDDEDDVPAKRAKAKTGDSTTGEIAEEDGDNDDTNLVHESLMQKPDGGDVEVEKAARTVFLSNVSMEAITSKSAKKTLLAHLSSVLDKDASPLQTVESLRFRSVPVATAAIPKRAAVITQAVMEATTKSSNAYSVYSSPAAARLAASKLNGTIVLERHLRVDSVAHPSPVDHRRCVFIGNLGFVDDETVINLKVDEDGNQREEKRKRTKTPMDVEEGLWRTFGKEAGKVESVRVVRDPATRVGKGIAYVQFYDANSVESALLLDGKKFPPSLPRALRVTRCKAPHKTLRAVESSNKAKAAALAGKKLKSTKYVRKLTDEDRTNAGRAGRLLGRAGAARAVRARRSGVEKEPKNESEVVIKSPEAIVFEGSRASAKDGKPRDLKLGKNKKGAKAASNNKKRRAARTTNWKNKGRL